MPITKVDVTPAHEQKQLDAMSWQELVDKKKQQLTDAIPAKWKLDVSLIKELTEANGGRLLELDPARRSGVLDDVEIDITENYSAVELVKKMTLGRLTATQVVTAFCKRAAVAQQLTSCLTESFYDEAIARAKFLDDYYRENGKTIGSLHGLPISLKDTFKVVGFDATAGYVNGLKLGPATTNSCLVSVLLDAGAVLYVKTNVPQTLMTADSENHIYGRTLNPHNLNLNAGGSSGGEGALVAFGGSPIGVGTDIAGSIRIPAMCCGTYGFKPTNHRVPYGNQSEGLILNLPGPFPSAGPIASTMEDLQLFMSAVINQRPGAYDTTALDLPWRKPAVGQSLRLGVLEEDPAWPLHPPVRRAFEDAINALSVAGHEVVRLPYDYERSVDLGLRLSYQFFELAHPPDEDLAAVLGEPLVKAAEARMHPFTAKPRPVPKDLAKPWHHLDDLDAARAKFAETWHRTWFDRKLDAIVAPGADKTAVPHDTYGLMPYTVVFNLLDIRNLSKRRTPSCQTVRGKLILISVGDKLTFGALLDDPSAVDGAPCGIQIVTLKLRDEECLAAAAVVDKIVNADRQK
ncbi:Acetamidase [Colletotrichum gloeosporioides]|uniref:amidase n=1 Tax=Colletotrichum gloeosporioides TaxID=474922 RepID=A0A8H4CG17_COLGL|nr:Acetamidase [Colletotrichum gloeosporioides]KAF3803107.1 Acetamidase [Colletotrichum gloeosporioides]